MISDAATLLAVAEILSPSLNGASAHRLALVAEADATAMLDQLEPDDAAWLERGLDRTPPERAQWWREEIERLGSDGVGVVTVADAEYPANLRLIPNRPPLLFVRGSLLRSDDRALAVVGTRTPGEEGTKTAFDLAHELASRGVTIVSGLAAGIDTAAHRGAMAAGGRTIAVFGTGIRRVYPAANRGLAAQVTESGACVSQFWPDTRGAKWTFPVRNVVTSGLSLGTVVVEAGETSGARLQAHDAIKHGKRLFLMRDLVLAQPWARDVARRDTVVTVDSVDEVVAAVEVELASDLTLI